MRNSYEIARYVKRIRERKGMSAVELARRMGVNKATISRYENGTRKISMDDIPKFAEVLGISPLDILVGEDREEEQSSEYPYFPVSISAGLPINIRGITDAEVETISIPNRIMGKWAGSRDIFFMRVNGDSMDKVIPHNSLVAVKHVELHSLKDGDIVVYSNGGDYAIKRFYKFDNTIVFRPDSHDNRFTDYVVSDNSSDIIIHGKVVLYIVEL